MDKICSKIVVVPFCNQTPMFLSKAFDKCVLNFKNQKKTCVVLPFFVQSQYRKCFNALILQNGKIEQIFGESFSNKKAEIKFENFCVNIMLFNVLYSLDEPKNVDKVNLFVAIDDEEKLENGEYLLQRFGQKLLFVGKNGKILVGKNFLNNKTNKKNVKIVIQNTKKLLN